jgi:hypothetical protein
VTWMWLADKLSLPAHLPSAQAGLRQRLLSSMLGMPLPHYLHPYLPACCQVGPDAAEIMQGLGIALKCGATKTQFDSCVGIHPSAAEEWVTMSTPARRGGRGMGVWVGCGVVWCGVMWGGVGIPLVGR